MWAPRSRRVNSGIAARTAALKSDLVLFLFPRAAERENSLVLTPPNLPSLPFLRQSLPLGLEGEVDTQAQETCSRIWKKKHTMVLHVTFRKKDKAKFTVSRDWPPHPLLPLLFVPYIIVVAHCIHCVRMFGTTGTCRDYIFLCLPAEMYKSNIEQLKVYKKKKIFAVLHLIL